jgi:hypothetical protein
MAKSKSSSSGPSPAMDADWRSESDHRTMLDAAQIQSDPDRMSGVKKHHKKQMKAYGVLAKSMSMGKS